MRIFDEDNDKVLGKVMLLLTEHEARELMDDLAFLLANRNEHAHVTDWTGEREITVAIYDERHIEHFSERIRQVIKDGK